jgi:hypothetical protein
VTTPALPPDADALLLCYCTGLTVGALHAACREGRWPLPGMERTGKLCTGCLGDLLYCLRALGAPGEEPSLEA